MKLLTYFSILFLSLFCCFIPTQAQEYEYSFYPLSLENGLSQSTIRSILLDNQGTLWLGTKRGVNAFKQHKFTSYYYLPGDTLSIPDNEINTITQDSTGQVWVGTAEGLSVYDRQQDKFIRKHQGGIYSSSATSNAIYFGGDNYILKYSLADQQFTTHIIKEKAPYGDTHFRVADIKRNTDGNFLLGTKEEGIFIMNSDNEEIHHLINNKMHLLQCMLPYPDGSIFVTTQGSGLFQYSKKGELKKTYQETNSEIGTNFLLDLIYFKDEIWICTDGEGIKILNPQYNSIRTLKHVPGNPFTLPTNAITTLFKTTKNQLWAGSVRRGAFFIKDSYIRTYGETAINNPNGLTEAAIISLYEDTDGMLWIGTDGGGINLFNPQTKKFKHFPSTYGDKIISVAQLNQEELLVSLYTKGMYTFNKRTGKYKPFIIVDKETNHRECFMGYLPMAHRVANDKIYIVGEYAWVYIPSKHEFRKIRTKDNGIIHYDGMVLAHSNQKFSLIMYKNKVFLINQENDRISPLFEISPDQSIVSLAYDEDHILWVATNMGLGYYDMEQKKYTSIPTKLFDSITFLTYDGKGRLWVGAQGNLFSYLIKDNKFTQINHSDGFIANEILFAYQNFSNKDYIYLGGSNGLVQIDNRIPKYYTAEPKIKLNDFLVNGVSANKSLKKQTLKVAYDCNSMILNLRIHNEDVFQRNLIKLAIIKDDVTQNFETYNTRIPLPTSLQPGSYELLASCFTKYGDLTEPVKLLELVVMPPWYKSNWFLFGLYLFCVCIVSAMAMLSYIKKAKKIRKNMYLYKQNVNEEKINFLINVNHELRTPLTLIYAPLKRIIEKGKDACHTAYSFEQLQLIYKQVGRMYNIINMVLDLNRVEAGNTDMKMDNHDLNKWVKDTSDDFLCEAHDKHINISYDFDERISTAWFDEWKCQIILSNLLMNAIKFSPTGSTIKVMTQLTEGHVIRIAVSDEGMGVADEDISRVFDRHYEGAHTCKGSGIGLAYSKMLTELHGGKMGVYNNKEKGATFFFELPQLNEEAIIGKEINSEATTLPIMNEHELTSTLKNYSVLIVEDTEDLRNFLQESFKDCFKHVYVAANGQEALELCYEKDPDIVVSDIMMPIMDGFELCSRIKTDQKISHIMVVLLTARCKENDEKLGYKLGADFYIKKPFDLDFLQTVLANMLTKRKQHVKEQFAQEIPSPQEITYSKADEDFLKKLNGIITENLSNEDLNINFITLQMGMSRASLYNKMSKITGLGVNDYMNRIRIEKAEDLLLHSSLSVKEISQEIGFAYPRYFSTTFKQVKGITPSEFKKKALEQNLHLMDE